MIIAKNITLSYEKDNIILDKMNFNIKDGEFVTICGPSGSGKSTFLKALYGKLEIDEGILEVNGVDISKKEYQQTLDLRKTMGIIFQDFKLISDFTVKNNIAAPLRILDYDENIITKQVDNLLTHIMLNHKANAHIDQLSGGEQQRVAVARAIGHNPKIILADEPTGSLDDYSANIVWDLLQNANQQLGITVIVVTHKIPESLNIECRKFHINDKVLYEAY